MKLEISPTTATRKVIVLILIGLGASCALAQGAVQQKPDVYQALRGLSEAQWKGEDSTSRSEARAVGESQSGVAGIAADAVQALGQIVVDRATQAAFELLKSKLEKLICESTTLFPQTCDVLHYLRLEEIATSRDALHTALVSDICHTAFAAIDGDSLTKALLLEVALPLLSNPPQRWDIDQITVLTERLVTLYMNKYPRYGGAHTDGEKAIFLAARAFWFARQVADTIGRPKFPAVDMLEVVRIANTKTDAFTYMSRPYSEALTLAMHFHRAATLTTEDSRPDVRGRLLHVTDALFQAAELLVDSDTMQARLEVAHALVQAVIDEDINGFVVASRKAFETFVQGTVDSKTDASRAVQLLGAVILYAETYTDSSSAAGQAQATRTRILSSLVLDRDERPGAWIVSAGGSLRLAAGGSMPRFKDPATGDRESKAYYGPALPLGFASDFYCKFEKHPRGFHVELGLLDLGRYLVYEDNQAKVNKPVLADAFAPSLTVGPFWGSDHPIFIGVVVGYSPNHSYDEQNPLHGGALNVGGTLGVYVPLFDFN